MDFVDSLLLSLATFVSMPALDPDPCSSSDFIPLDERERLVREYLDARDDEDDAASRAASALQELEDLGVPTHLLRGI